MIRKEGDAEVVGIVCSIAAARHRNQSKDSVVFSPRAFPYLRRTFATNGMTRSPSVMSETELESLRQELAQCRERERRYRRMSDAMQKFQSLAEHSPDNIARLDRSLRYVYVNPSFAATIGMPREEIIGKTNEALGIPEALIDAWESSTRRTLENGSEEWLEFHYNTPQGERYFESRLVPEYGPDGRTEHLLTVTRDLTDHKRAEEAQRRTAAALRERVKELDCLYAVASLMQENHLSLPEVLRRTMDALAIAYQYPGVTCVRIIVDGRSYTTDGFRESPWRQAARINQDGRDAGLVEVFYREDRPEEDEGPFLKEERALLDAVASLLARGLHERHEREARARAEAALKGAERIAHLGSWEWDKAQGVTHWSDEMFRMAGYEPGAFQPEHDAIRQVVHPDDRARFVQCLNDVLETGERWHAEHRVLDRHGKERVVDCRIEAITDGTVTGLRGTWLDITDRKRFEDALRESEERLRLITDSIDDVFWLNTAEWELLYVSPACRRIFGYGPDELLQDPERLLAAVHPDDRERVRASLFGKADRPFEALYRVTRPDGTLRWVRDRGYPTAASFREGGPLIARVSTDITRLRQAEEQVEATVRELKAANRRLDALSRHDALTGLANRRYLFAYLDEEWRRERRHDHPLSLIIIDIDHFKAFNDTYGHRAGDECLRLVADRLRRQLRRPGDLLARYGGEEFVVVLPDTPLQGAVRLAEAMRRAVTDLQLPHATSGVAPHVTVSLGVASLLPSRHSLDELFTLADRALYRAKSAGRDRVVDAEGTDGQPS